MEITIKLVVLLLVAVLLVIEIFPQH